MARWLFEEIDAEERADRSGLNAGNSVQNR